ncbi:polysaccharide deacetylase family protein [Clostridium sp. MB40-C1]|uniref:polysaccharide deacetylase family protein n=1 Tax=Clostridium sp. MB40-C1 TaxID=3070996 RepID=UPI0027DEB2CD|nr:polysaccharide deacetylase family protein [Clostridium sp. MB40-C1]WMJ82178.1 polysaccharide deacetylase family protein [Clostridium sp. MB40-C1]
MSTKKSNKTLKIVQVALFAILIFCISNIAIAESKVIKVKSENKNLSKQINEIKNTNQKLNEENQKLQSSIDEKKSSYEEKMKDVKIAYLTFDDGPSKNTLDILKTLKEYNVKATFFVNGHEELTPLYKKIAEEGHALANHTYSHNYKTIYSSVNNFENDIKKLDKFLTQITGKEPTHVFRFPGGSNNTVSRKYGGKTIMKDIIKEMDKEGYVYFDWNVDSTDASAFRQNKDKIVSSVINQSKHTNKAVVLMHDLNPKTTTVQALPEIINGLKAQGFVFDVMSKNSPQTQFVKVNNVK